LKRYGSGDPDPDSHQNVTDPQLWQIVRGKKKKGKYETQRLARPKGEKRQRIYRW
jgi:hypothetical protein